MSESLHDPQGKKLYFMPDGSLPVIARGADYYHLEALTGTAEVDTLMITESPTVSGNVTITLNGVAVNIAVVGGTAEVATVKITAAATEDSEVTISLNGTDYGIAVQDGDTINQVAAKIRATHFEGYTVSGATDTAIFTANEEGAKTATTFDGGVTGVTATVTTTTDGTDPDSLDEVATKIRAGTYTGWTASGSGAEVIFTKSAAGDVSDPVFDPGTTGTVGAMVKTTDGSGGNLLSSESAVLLRIHVTKAGSSDSLILVYANIDDSDSTKIVSKMDGSVTGSFEFGVLCVSGLSLKVTGTTAPILTAVYAASPINPNV